MKYNHRILSLLLAIWILSATFASCELPNANSTPTDTTVADTALEGNSPDETIDRPSDESNDTTTAPESPSESPSESTSDTTIVPEDSTAPDESTTEPERVGTITILKGAETTLEAGKGVRILISKSSFITERVVWTSSDTCVCVDDTGYVTAISVGNATVTASAGGASDSILIHVIEPDTSDEIDSSLETAPRDEVLELAPREEIFEAVNASSAHQPAKDRTEALDRASKGELAGYDYVPDQAPNLSPYRPTENGKYIKNSVSHYVDDDTYVVIDAYGREVFRIYRGGAYITLEEVAAYVYAFGTVPANHSASKSTKPSGSIWGEYLRVNNTKFSGNTSRYPYEPELPRISGCGGDLTYWEMDIGTTGTDCDPSYTAKLYNNGTKITRGAARIVYTWNDLNKNRITDANDIVYIFYTYNHYNDFQEYLNYYGGWGEMFGNITGGGTISSTTRYNPTVYVPVTIAPLLAASTESAYIEIAWINLYAPEIIKNRRFNASGS